MILVLQGLAIVGLSVALAAGVLLLVRRTVKLQADQEHNQVAGTTAQVLGTAFTVLLAFVVVVVWQEYQDAGGTVLSESVEIAALFRLSRGLPDPAGSEARETIAAYTRAVIDDEWPAMTHGGESRRAHDLIGDLWQTYNKVPPAERQSGTYSESLRHLASIEERREQRLLDARGGLAGIFWVVLVSGAVVTVTTTCFLLMRDLRAHVVLTSGLAGIIALILFTIFALNHPFRGGIAIGPDAFEQVLGDVIEAQRPN